MPPSVNTLRATPLTQSDPRSCGAAVAARILSATPGVAIASQATLEMDLFRDINRRYYRKHPGVSPDPELPDWDDEHSDPNEPIPPEGANGGRWGSTPDALVASLNKWLNGGGESGPYKVVSHRVRDDDESSRRAGLDALLAAMLGSMDSGWPTPVLSFYGGHWVLAYRYRVEGSGVNAPYADVELISPQFDVAAATKIVDLTFAIADHGWLHDPIQGGTVLPNHFVALAVDAPTPQPLPPQILVPLPGGPVKPITDVAADRLAATEAAIRRFAKTDARWLSLLGALKGAPVRIERLAPGGRPLDLIPILGTEPGLVVAVVLFDTITGRVAEGTHFVGQQRLRYDTSRRLVWEPCVESTAAWLPFYDDSGGVLERVDGRQFHTMTPLQSGW